MNFNNKKDSNDQTRTQTLMDAFPVTQDLNLKDLNFSSNQNRDKSFDKRSTVFGTAMRDHIEEMNIKMERPTDPRILSVNY